MLFLVYANLWFFVFVFLSHMPTHARTHSQTHTLCAHFPSKLPAEPQCWAITQKVVAVLARRRYPREASRHVHQPSAWCCGWDICGAIPSAQDNIYATKPQKYTFEYTFGIGDVDWDVTCWKHIFLHKLCFEAILGQIFLHTPSWPPCFRDLKLREQPRAHLSAAACFPGDNNSLIPQMELYFPSPSSSVLLTFTSHPSLHLHPPPTPVGSQTAPVTMRFVVWSQRKRRMEDKWKAPYFPSAPLIIPDWFWGFLISFLSSVSFSLELPGITWNQTLSLSLDPVSLILF